MRAGGAPDVRSGFLPDRIIHLHPTRLCNLACLHCYSESDPTHTAALDPDVLCRGLAVLAEEGYRVISLSGGEPLVYRPLRVVIDQARVLGLRVTMITNGLLATERMDPVLRLLDGLAVSFDGLEPTHNRIRGRPDAFRRASVAVQRLAGMGGSVAAAVSVRRDAIPELPELADTLVSLGARALQIRPVARAGRARTLDAGAFYSASDYARLYLVVEALRQELPAGVRVHCDVAPAIGLWQQREAYVGLLGQCEGSRQGERPLSDLVNPLVITETGVLKPIAYDFDRAFDVGALAGLSPSNLQEYRVRRLPLLKALVGGALASLQGHNGFVDWFDHCTRLSEGRENAGCGPVKALGLR